MRIYNAALLLFICTIILSCKPAIDEKSHSHPEDIDGSWELVSILGDTTGLGTAFQERKPSIIVSHSSQTIKGYSGCNAFSGNIELTGDSIKVLPLTSTQRGCTTDVESIFFIQLYRANRFRTNKDSLQLMDQDSILLSFTRSPSSPK